MPIVFFETSRPSACHAIWLFFGLLMLQSNLLFGGTISRAGLDSEPLAERSQAELGAPLFTELDASAIGLGNFINNYSNPELWTKRWHEYLHGAAGTGVGIGDLNGDGLPDLFVVSKDETSKLFLNQGSMQFADFTSEAGIVKTDAPATGVSFVDVDNNGRLDIYLCFIGSPNQLWINDGNARFEERAEAWGVAFVGGSSSASFADYDRDGDMDLYLQTNLVQSGTIQIEHADRLFENEGDHFIEVTEKAGIEGKANGHSATWWDFNDDQWPDIYVANDYAPHDKLYRNNQDGTFTNVISEVMPQTPYSSMGSDFGDINNDGLFDFLGTDMATKNRMKHMQTSPSLIVTHTQTKAGEAFQYAKNTLLLQTRPGRFTDIAYLAGVARTDWTWTARLADLDNDGWLDVFVSNGMLRELHFKDMGARLLRLKSPLRVPLLFKNEPALAEQNFAYRNQRNLRFEDASAAWGLDKVGVSFGAATGDLDGDGALDLVVVNYQEPVSVYRNNGSQGNRTTIRLLGEQSNSYGIDAKAVLKSGGLTQTRALYLSRGYLSSNEPIIHFGLGDATRIESLEIFWPSGNYQKFEDLPANHHFRITEDNARQTAEPVVPSTYFTAVSLGFPANAKRTENYFNEFKRQPLLPFKESNVGGSISLGDIDEDGSLDIALGGSVGQSLLLLLNDGHGNFSEQLSFDLEDDYFSKDWDAKLVDLNGDGRLDLVVASGGVEVDAGSDAYANRIYYNSKGSFDRDWNTSFSDPLDSSKALSIADFNKDGYTDIFVAGLTLAGKYPHHAPSTLWRNGPEGLRRVDSEVAPGLTETGRVSDAQWVDIDSDGDLDLVLTREWDSPQIWFNEDGSLTPASPQIGLNDTGLWTTLSCEDFDGDGLVDILVGNLGLNTEYETSTESPMRIWYKKDPKAEGGLILTQHRDGYDWPIQERWELEKSYPEKMAAIESEAAYVQLSFKDIFDETERATYTFKEISELRSGIYWQEMDGSFNFEPLPSFAQSGRAMYTLVKDINGDGINDIVFSLQPLYPDPWSENIETGHLGLFLNEGNRSFRSVLPTESGLQIEGRPRELAWGDLTGNGYPELIVYLSDNFPQAFSLNKSLKKQD